jgi:hypothetical protein
MTEERSKLTVVAAAGTVVKPTCHLITLGQPKLGATSLSTLMN